MAVMGTAWALFGLLLAVGAGCYTYSRYFVTYLIVKEIVPVCGVYILHSFGKDMCLIHKVSKNVIMTLSILRRLILIPPMIFSVKMSFTSVEEYCSPFVH